MNVSLAEAHAVLEGAQTAAREMGIAVTIAVFDSGAHLTAFARMDGSILGSIDIALKAEAGVAAGSKAGARPGRLIGA